MLTNMCCHIVATLPHLTGPMWFWEDAGVTLLWDPELAPDWLSQVCFCPLSRPPCPWGDRGGLPTWPWFSVLAEGELCLACVWGLEECEAEQRRGIGLPSCVVTEIWGSERPVKGKKMNKIWTRATLYIVSVYRTSINFIHFKWTSTVHWLKKQVIKYI